MTGTIFMIFVCIMPMHHSIIFIFGAIGVGEDEGSCVCVQLITTTTVSLSEAWLITDCGSTCRSCTTGCTLTDVHNSVRERSSDNLSVHDIAQFWLCIFHKVRHVSLEQATYLLPVGDACKEETSSELFCLNFGVAVTVHAFGKEECQNDRDSEGVLEL